MCVRTHFSFVFEFHFITFGTKIKAIPVKRRKVTIQDVARYANVSAGTIDRVIHNRGRVSPEKKKRVVEAIEKLNFNPNMLARTLALGRQFMVCALIPSAPTADHYWSAPLQGLQAAAAQYRDYGIAVDYFFYDLFDEASFTEQAENILSLNPDGVVFAPLFLQESYFFAEKLKSRNIPYVFIDADLPDGQSLSYIGPELKQSAYIAGKLLCSTLPQHAEILVVNMVKGFENASALQRMEEGFREYFSKNAPGREKRIHTLTIHSIEKNDVFRELGNYYSENSGIKGVFVTNSQAFLLSRFHQENNLDIRLVGFDLVAENIAHLKNGGIDYIISQSPVQQGKRAVKTLFEFFLYGKAPDKIQYIPLDVIIRENVDFYLNFNGQNMNGTDNDK